MYVVSCSNCDKPLLEFDDSGVLDGEQATKKCRVECCYCGDHSLYFNFKMGTRVCGITKITPDLDYVMAADGKEEIHSKYDDIKHITRLSGMPREGDSWLFKTSKG